MIRKILLLLSLVLVSTGMNAQKSDNYRSNLRDKSVTIDGGKLPIVFINTKNKMIQTNSYILAYMKIINNEDNINNSDTINHPNQTVDHEGWIAIKYRGNTSFSSSDKKPYAIQTLKTDTLPDDGGSKDKVKILGMGKDNKWVMLAPWSDRSMIRDALAFNLERPWMDFTPHTKFCEVILDGTYFGVYIFTEKVSQGKKRLNLHDPGTDNSDLTGDYIVKIDRSDSPYYESKYSPWASLSGGIHYSDIKYQYVFPDDEDFAEFPGSKAALQAQIDSMEDAFNSTNYKDSINGYRKYIDTNSFLDYMLITELAMNIDGYRLSTNLYKYSKTRALTEGLDSRWKMSLWDFNIAFGNANYYDGYMVDQWQYDFNSKEAGESEVLPFYWYKMLNDPWYVDQMKSRWQAYRESNFSLSAINAEIDSLASCLINSGAQERNEKAWQVFDRWSIWPVPSYYQTMEVTGCEVTDYPSEITYMKTWIKKRLDFMDSQILGGALDPDPTTDPETEDDVAKRTVPFEISGGFTEDIIAESTPVANYTSTGVDAGNVFYTSDVNTSGGISSNSVVANGTKVKYSFSAFDGNNALLVDGSHSGTLTLAEPAQTNNVYVLGTSTNGASTMNVKINYTDGTSSQKIAITFKDWSNRTPSGEEAISGLGRCSRDGDSFASDPHYCMYDATVEADATREVESVTVTYDSGARAFITALSGDLITHDAILIADNATSGTSGNESYLRLFDDDVNTKWGFNWKDNNVSVIFHATYPVAVESYTITTANDNTDYKGRNPKSWNLYGSTAEEEPSIAANSWELIDQVDDSKMTDVNFTPFTFNVGSETPYRYFKWEITDRMGYDEDWLGVDTYVQMSEFDITTATKDETSGIADVISISKGKGDNNIYDLQGRKMNTTHLPSGIYIKNGKKFVVN